MSTWLGFDEPDGMDDVASIQPEELYALLKKQDAHDRLLVLDVRQTDAIVCLLHCTLPMDHRVTWQSSYRITTSSTLSTCQPRRFTIRGLR